MSQQKKKSVLFPFSVRTDLAIEARELVKEKCPPEILSVYERGSNMKKDDMILNFPKAMPKLTIKKANFQPFFNQKYNKFHTFDHHQFNLVANEYPFGTAISTNEMGVNECATSLFYKYLLWFLLLYLFRYTHRYVLLS